MSWQLVEPVKKELFRQPGLVCNQALRTPTVVETPKIEEVKPEETPKKKGGRPRKIQTTEDITDKPDKPKKKLDVSKAKVY